jgi:hypothetical protein
MMTDITIPPEAVEAARRAFTEAMLSVPQEDPIASALRAGIAAWPNIERAKWSDRTFILPFPKENTNAEG